MYTIDLISTGSIVVTHHRGLIHGRHQNSHYYARETSQHARLVTIAKLLCGQRPAGIHIYADGWRVTGPV